MRRYKTAQEAQVNLNLKISRMIKALKYLEWSHVDKVSNEKCCPDCGNSEAYGHWDKCYLYNALIGI